MRRTLSEVFREVSLEERVAVSARLAPISVAEDTAGSSRVPAAMRGIVGFRPTTAGILRKARFRGRDGRERRLLMS
jgi:hypothetical protein